MAKEKEDKKAKKQEKLAPKKKPGRVMTTAQKVSNLDEAVIKKIVEDKKEEMSVSALEIAREMAARMDLEIDRPLDQLQNEAALLYANANSLTAIGEKLGISITQLEEWLKTPSWMKKANEYTFSLENIQKNRRIQLANKRNEILNNTFFEKVDNDELKNLPITTIAKMIVDSNSEISALVDKTEEKGDNNNIQIMIVNHFKNQGKEYSTLDDFLKDPGFDFRKNAINIESEEV